jgi:RHH-type proline utilization regulon transcriptional repressor/proline dehydrogenase/delta 1-pyrroline-5-carboxylate dehydrogenase
MQKSPTPANGVSVSVVANAPLPLFDQQLRKSENAFKRWNTDFDRRTVFANAAANAQGEFADLFRLASALYGENFEQTVDLPGPTGESNSLRMKGRGIIACLGGGPASANRRQIALALAAGNAVICPSTLSDRITQALSKAGAPDDLVTGLPSGHAIHEAVLLDSRIRAVSFDGDAVSRKAVRSALARRSGAIAPLLCSLDQPWRYAVERTLTINTTAAGGDVRLLSLPE